MEDVPAGELLGLARVGGHLHLVPAHDAHLVQEGCELGGGGVEDLLVGQGLNQIMTYALISRPALEKARYEGVTPIVLQKGQGLRSIVTYVNTTTSNISFGLMSDQEMDIIFGYYY